MKRHEWQKEGQAISARFCSKCGARESYAACLIGCPGHHHGAGRKRDPLIFGAAQVGSEPVPVSPVEDPRDRLVSTSFLVNGHRVWLEMFRGTQPAEIEEEVTAVEDLFRSAWPRWRAP